MAEAVGRGAFDANDDIAIRNVVARAAWTLDNWVTPEQHLENYTPDAVWTLEGGQSYVGHSGIGQRLQEMLEQKVCGPGLTTRHGVMTLEVIPDPADSSRASARWVSVMLHDRTGPFVMGYGEVHDELIRGADGGWRIDRRHIIGLGWGSGDDLS